MRLIPVIDLQHGEVVYAVGGQRDHYQPLRTTLSASTTFTSVANGLLTHFPTSDIYVADLDAIQGRAEPAFQVNEFCARHGHLNVWSDIGIKDFSHSIFKQALTNQKIVLGTETLLDVSGLQKHMSKFADKLVLSLDFRGSEFLGPALLLDQSGLWPSRVIVMSLDVVGKGQGPDFKRIAEIVEVAGGREVYAAGGVRSLADLKQLGEIGAAGALVATALHTGQIKTGDLDEIAGF